MVTVLAVRLVATLWFFVIIIIIMIYYGSWQHQLNVARVNAGLAESNGSVPPGL